MKLSMKSPREKQVGVTLHPCKGCGELIHFVETHNGRLMPCNAKKLTVITLLGDVVSGWEAHFATCTQADMFRKKKEHGEKQSTAGI